MPNYKLPICTLTCGLLVLAGCSNATEVSTSPDARPAIDAAMDSGMVLADSGPGDVGSPNVPTDAGVRLDAETSEIDAGADIMDASGPVDAEVVDAGPPTPPGNLVHYITGNPADAVVNSTGPGLILMGGGPEVDDAFVWAHGRVPGADVVIIRTSGSDGYNDYLFTDIGGIDSVETMLVTSRALANHPYVADRLRKAESIFLAGGDQSTYAQLWRGTEVQTALRDAWLRGAMLGGTSAGLAMLGEFAFEAINGGVTSATVVANPYHSRVTLGRNFVDTPPLAGLLTDSHFRPRDRMGRLAGFLCRIIEDGWHARPIGLGIDERTALIIDSNGTGRVLGDGGVYVLRPNGAPETCQPGTSLTFRDLTVTTLAHGDALSFPGAMSSATERRLDIVEGVLSPSDPYVP